MLNTVHMSLGVTIVASQPLAFFRHFCYNPPMHLSPLRYPGGKAVLSDRITEILLKTHLLGGTFVEPFCGGAGVALALLSQEKVSKVILNDVDFRVSAFWDSVLNQNDEFTSQIRRTEVTMEERERQKWIFESPGEYSLFFVGFATFFLNRTNRSGILGGGAIGGAEQDGEYNIESRFNKVELIRRIQRLKLYRDRIAVHKLDAVTFMEEHVVPLSGNTLVYLDPPYFNKAQSLYHNYFNFADHERLASFLGNKLKHPWVLSYDLVPEIQSLYSESKSHTLDVPYSAHSTKVGKEVLYFGPQSEIWSP